MMVWLAVVGFLLLLLFLPLGFRICYDDNGLRVILKFGPIQTLLYPRRRSNKEDNKSQEFNSQKTKNATGNKQSTNNRRFSDFFPVLQLVYDFLKDFRKKLRVSILELRLVVAGSDPSDVAINYGRAWSVIGGLMPLLDQVFTIRFRNVCVDCDFLSSQTRLLGRVEFTITVGRMLHLLGFHGVRILRSYLKIMKKRKGGARA